MAGENEKLDPDILKAKMDILRARNSDKNKKSQEDKNGPEPLEMSDLMSDVVKANKTERQKADRSDIPEFDVSKRILPQQRDATASRRTAPRKVGIKEIQTQSKLEPSILKQKTSTLYLTIPNHNSLISEIVARDIRLILQN